jgi:hypothetical protein
MRKEKRILKRLIMKGKKRHKIWLKRLIMRGKNRHKIWLLITMSEKDNAASVDLSQICSVNDGCQLPTGRWYLKLYGERSTFILNLTDSVWQGLYIRIDLLQ